MRPISDKKRAFITLLKKKMNFKSLVVTLAAIVVFTTTYLLILPAFTLDKEEAAEQGGIDVAVEQNVDEEAPAEKVEEPAADQKESEEAATEAEEPAAKEEVKEETAPSKQKDNDAQEEKKDSDVKEEKEEVRLLSKKKELTAEKEKGDDFTISAVVDKDSKVPEDVFLQAAELTKDTEDFDYDKYYKDALKALKKDSSSVKEIKTIRFYDISLEADSQDESVEPKAAVSVKIAYDDGLKVKDADNIRIVHFAEQKNGEVKAEVLDSKENKVETTVNKKSEMTEASFDTEGFSVFAVAETDELTGGIVTADGSAYEVTVKYGADAGVPDGATLEVSELTKDSEEYQKYMEQTAEAVGTAVEDLDYLKLLDISIMDGDEKVEIQAPVDVQIKLLDKKDADKNAGEKTKVVHFGKDETAVIEPDVEGATVNFETTGFSYYAVTSYGATEALNGKSYAIVQVNTRATQDAPTGNNTVHAGRALSTTAQNNNTRLAGTTVNVEEHESGKNLVTSGTTQIVEWKFVSAGGANAYYIQAPNGQYLTLNGNNALVLSGTPQSLTVTADGERVRISNGDRRVQSSASANNSSVSNNQYFQNGNSNDANYIDLTLCEIKEFDPDQYPVYEGEKVSVQDLVDGQEYIIYKNIYNKASGKYEDWVIDGNGNPVRAYDQGDSLSLHSKDSPMWKLSILTDSAGQPTGYYLFVNEETGMVLHPTADGKLVKPFDSATSPTKDGVTLDGRKKGEYTSPIEYWDGSAMAYYGYQFSSDDTVTLSSVREENVQALSFAGAMPSQAGLHTVDTVNSTAAGITIHMFNYPNRDTIKNVTGSDGYAVGVIPKQHVKATLSESGYPQFTNGKNGSTLFDPSNTYHQGTGNHLFLESVYDSTGYYEYSAFNNFAHYDKNSGNFKVYQETGTPSPTSGNFYYKRGNFFPYNELNTNNKAQNIYTGSGTLIDYDNPSYGSTLYGLNGTDFYFGMTMNFNFLMPKDGYEKGSPLIYEFNGDDDLWIYIDDVLILDIGGVHDAFPGAINFVTGEITGGNGGAGGARTIKDCFKNAGVFPDGTRWDDSKADEYFNGNTFANYGSHEFNMFYMEHGAGASNLMTRFNLPVIEKGKVTVEKKLDNTSQVDYANVPFAYQAFAKIDGEYRPLTSAVYEGTTTDVPFYNNVNIKGNTYNNVFYLKPNEAAVFSDMIEDELYYVQEIGIDSDYYDQVSVNDVAIEGEQVIEEDGIYKSTEATARNRARVTFKNRCDERNSNELRITKRLANGSQDNGDTFEFRVMLENASGELVPYYQGTYYIHDDEGVYYRYEGGVLVPNGQTAYPCTAGNNGTISHIPPDFTVEIRELVAGTDFYVDEIRVRPNGGNLDASDDVLIGDSDWELVSTTVENEDPSEISDADIWDYSTGKNIKGSSMGRIAWGEKDAQVTFTNKYTSTDVALKKVDDKGNTLSGASFDLTKFTKNAWSNVQTGISPGAAATASSEAVPNPVDLGALGVGRYRLEEKASPDGYIILSKFVYFEVYKDTDKQVKVRFTDENGTPLTDAQIEELSGTAILTPASGDDPYTITIKNIPGEELPMTGGIGTTIFYILGSILVVGCGLVLIARKRAGISR